MRIGQNARHAGRFRFRRGEQLGIQERGEGRSADADRTSSEELPAGEVQLVCVLETHGSIPSVEATWLTRPASGSIIQAPLIRSVFLLQYRRWQRRPRRASPL